MQGNINRLSEKDIHFLLEEHIGEKYTLYRSMWNSTTVDDIPKYPIHIDFELNDKCNQSCVMCPRNAKTHPEINYVLGANTSLPFQMFKSVIDDGAPKGLMSINLGAFAEPLLHKDCFEMISYAHSKGIVDSRLITNGLLLDRHVNEIFESGLVNLFVSIDAFTESGYASIRGAGFQKVKDNLLKILSEKKRRGSFLPIVRVSFVDMNANKSEKDDFINYWIDKVDHIDIQVFDDYNVDVTKPFDKAIKKKWDCFSPWARVAVLSNGDVLPCCNFFGRNIPIGSLNKNSISEIWKNEKTNDIRCGIVNDDLQNCSICQRVG